MVQTHEYNVNNNTESDEELCEGVKHNDGEHLGGWEGGVLQD